MREGQGEGKGRGQARAEGGGEAEGGWAKDNRGVQRGGGGGVDKGAEPRIKELRSQGARVGGRRSGMQTARGQARRIGQSW